MAPPPQRRCVISESSDDEEFPNAWEEMRRRLEPVGPATMEQTVEVITIEDTPNPLGDEPSFEILDSLTQEDNDNDAPERLQSPQPGPSDEVLERAQSPQPGPSGIQQDYDDDNDIVEERWFSISDKNVGTLAADHAKYDELTDSLVAACTGFTALVDKFKATATLAYDYKEAYRACRKTLKRKREDCVLAEAEVQREKRRCKEALDANELLINDLATEQRESHDFKQQRDLAEADVMELTTELAKAKSKAYRDRRYRAALKETIADKDATIARLETELSQVRKHLHQFTRISCPRGQRPGSSTWVDAEEDSTDEEET